MAARRFNRSYFGRKPNGEIDGGGYFVQKIPVRFGKRVGDGRRSDEQEKAHDEREMPAATRRIWAGAAFVAAAAVVALVLAAGRGVFLATGGFRFLLQQFSPLPQANAAAVGVAEKAKTNRIENAMEAKKRMN